MKQDFETLLKGSAEAHGHLCPGQVVGLRMAMLGCDLILPRLLAGEKPDNKDLARFAHGDLCIDCHPCRFPACSFGKTG